MSTFSAGMMALAGPMAKKVLTSIGVGIVSYAGLSVAVNSALGAAKGALGGMAADYAALAAMSGVFTAAGIIAGGITAGVTMVALKRFQLLTG